MQLTDYHAKYFAYELTKRCAPDSMEKLAGAVAGAQVDLNPHQVDAALFAFNSPLSKGALLAEMLITVSKSLLEGARIVIEQQLDPEQTLCALIDRHIEFALSNPDLIKVHERDFSNLDVDDARQVRRLQRQYVELWVDQIQLVRQNETQENARTMAHAIFGMLNSTSRLRSDQRRNEVATLMLGMAQKALLT